MKSIWDRVKLTPREQTKLDRNFEDAITAMDVDRPTTTHTLAMYANNCWAVIRDRSAIRADLDTDMELTIAELATGANEAPDADTRQVLSRIKTTLEQAWATLTMRNRWQVAATIKREVGETVADMLIATAVMI